MLPVPIVVMGAALVLGVQEPLPELVIEHPGTQIDHSCRVVIPPGTLLPAVDDPSAIEIVADNVTVEFAPGSVLRAAGPDVPLDKAAGVGIRINGHAGVTLRHIACAGYKASVYATGARGLVIDGATVESGYGRRLKSTVRAEDESDWLWPHKNDKNEWLTTYGAAVYIEDCDGVTVHDVTVRRCQNGIVLDRVDDSRVHDSDCSFLSGWGLAMWRSSRNTIAHNALDFCIRGYSHGVYNRGQDSAGILMFEQCAKNIIAENSATHCGDGFFGFAGREALGETWIDERKAAGQPVEPVPEAEAARHAGAGCNDNMLIGNDFSYAAAHGIEMTFSRGNTFLNNRLVGNAICGVWGGYSSRTLIMGNTVGDNGDAGYGEERGGINIEHGRDNRIVGNTFSGNALGVRLWARAGSPLVRTPWGVANSEGAGDARGVPSARNIVTGNSFSGEKSALVVRNSSDTTFAGNTSRNVRLEIDAEGGTTVDLQPAPKPEPSPMPAELPGVRRPVAARTALNGREQIVMGEWGPWDHATPMVRLRARESGADVYEVRGVAGELKTELEADGVTVSSEGMQGSEGGRLVRVAAKEESGVWPYRLRLRSDTLDTTLAGTIVRAAWKLTAFPWTHDPITNVDAWRTESKGANSVAATVPTIDFPLGYKGPSRIGIAPEIDAAKIGAVKYGLLARTTLPLKAGRWAIRTMSDDGIRVRVDGTAVIERWDIHGPMPDVAVLTFEADHVAEIEVEYFQNDGHAVLTVEIVPAEGAP